MKTIDRNELFFLKIFQTPSFSFSCMKKSRNIVKKCCFTEESPGTTIIFNLKNHLLTQIIHLLIEKAFYGIVRLLLIYQFFTSRFGGFTNKPRFFTGVSFFISIQEILNPDIEARWLNQFQKC